MPHDLHDYPFPLVRDEAAHPDLAHWRHNVGAPVSLDLAPPPNRRVRTLDVLCWNVAIGQGRLRELLEWLRERRDDRHADAQRPLVMLLQEAYRSDATVPPLLHSWHHGGQPVRGPREDIVDVARELGLSLRYAPSMRNGEHRSDRGNAVLSSLPLRDAIALKLPYVRQRRVAVAATLPDTGGLAVVSAHLDTRGQPRPGHRWGRFGAGRKWQADTLGRRVLELLREHSIVLGADLNTPLGMRDPAVRALLEAGFLPAERSGNWRGTYRAPVRLLLDHVLHHSPDGRVRSVTVQRLDDERGPRSRVFGSDHHPLLARVELA